MAAKALIGIGLLWLIAWSAAGQVLPPEEHFRRYTTADGLPDNNITCIEQDEQGFVWVGTNAGLSCFDGVRFTNYFKGKTFHNALPSNFITVMSKLPGGKILIGTRFGLSLLDTRRRSFKSVLIPYEAGMEWTQNSIGAIVFTHRGEIVAGSSAGICVFDTALNVLYQYSHFDADDQENERLGFAHSMMALPDGDVLIRGWSGFWRYRCHERKVETQDADALGFENGEEFVGTGHPRYFFHYTTWPDSFFVHDALSGKTGVTPVSKQLKTEVHWRFLPKFVNDTLLGLSQHYNGFRTAVMNPATLQVRFSQQAIFNHVHFNQCLYDRENRWWLASENGLYVQSLSKSVARFVPIEAGLDRYGAPDALTSIIRAGEHFFVGTNYKLILLNKGLQRQRTFELPPHWHSLWGLYHWQPDVLEIGCSEQWGRLRLPIDKDHAPQWQDMYQMAVMTQKKDKQGMIWSGGARGVLKYDSFSKEKFPFYKGRPGGDFPFAGAHYIAETDSGYVWMCGPFSFSRWNPRQRQFDRQFRRVPGTDRQEGYQLNLVKNKGEELLFTLYGNGLWRWHGDDHPAQRVPANHPSLDFILDIEPDTRPQHYWLAIKSGIALFDLETGRHRFLPAVSDSILSGGLGNEPLFLDGQTDSLYVVYSNGILVLNSRDIGFSNRAGPVYITDVQHISSHKRLPFHGYLKLRQSDSDLAISFAAPDYEYGQAIQYAYRLNGGDWQALGAGASVRFARLKQGKYLFEVKSVTSEGISSRPDSLSFEVLPLFYQTWWFSLCLATGFVLAVWWWFRRRIGQLNKMETMRQALAADLHDEVGASLTSVQILAQLAAHGDPKRRSEALGKLPEQVRHTSSSLREIVWNIQPGNDDLNLLAGRLMRYAGEFLERADIRYDLHADEFSGHLRLDAVAKQHLARIFKEALNNVAKHSGADFAEVVFKQEKNKLLLTIRDQGRGFDPDSAAPGNGLNNMQLRAQLAGGSLDIETRPGQGVRLALRLPLRNVKKWRLF